MENKIKCTGLSGESVQKPEKYEDKHKHKINTSFAGSSFQRFATRQDVGLLIYCFFVLKN
jgi:hypothetical protein